MSQVEVPSTLRRYLTQVCSTEDLHILCEMYGCEPIQVEPQLEEEAFLHFILCVLTKDTASDDNFQTLIVVATVVEVIRANYTIEELLAILPDSQTSFITERASLPTFVLLLVQELIKQQTLDTFLRMLEKEYPNQLGRIDTLKVQLSSQ